MVLPPCVSFFFPQEVYFYFFIFFFTLQYCIGFAIYQHESATGVHMFPILNPSPTSLPSHPSGSSQCTSPKHPVSCIKPRLAIRFLYDIIHVSMPFSQIITPSPSPTESKRLFYTPVSLLLSHIQGYCYHLSKFHIYALVYRKLTFEPQSVMLLQREEDMKGWQSCFPFEDQSFEDSALWSCLGSLKP